MSTPINPGIYVSSSRRPLSGRKPKTKEAGRTCMIDGCETILSRYNKKDRCYSHTSRRFPRVRGRKLVA